ncbi:MAG: hypothetical protein ACLF0P_00105 [Thermoanaerobaculia bacterium]
MTYDLLGFALVAVVALAAGNALAGWRRNPFPRNLVMAGVVLHIAGSVARLEMMQYFYGGVADANRYYHVGMAFARRAWDFDLRMFSPVYWFGGPESWWGTPFMEKLAGLVLTFIGPTRRGAFLVFAMLAFLGLYWIALALYRTNPGRAAVRFASWVWFWPSLLFWPSSLGKESVTLFAVGLTTLGYVGRRGRISWVPFLAGLGIAFALRPHVAGALALASAGAYWFQSWTRPSPRRIAEAVAAAGLSLLVLSGMSAQLGFEPDLEGVQEYIDHRSDFTVRGGSQLEGVPSGPAAIPMAFVNIWMRPFLWEAHNVMALISAVELSLLWILAWRYRRRLRQALAGWWSDRLLAFAVPLLFGYTTMIGLTFANMGIIARQRSPIFPFIMLLFLGGGRALLARRQWSTARRVPVRPRSGPGRPGMPAPTGPGHRRRQLAHDASGRPAGAPADSAPAGRDPEGAPT